MTKSIAVVTADCTATGLTGAGCILRVGASKQERNTVVQREMGAVAGDGCNGTLCGLAL